MSRLIGFMSNRTDLLADALEREPAATRGPLTGDAWGIGFYQGGEILHRKRPIRAEERLAWSQLAEGVRTDCALLHLRHATVGGFRSENTHPFRMRRWLFTHSGTIPRFDVIQPRCLETMPDFLRRNIRGETDSEHIFHVTLSLLYEMGQLDVLDPDPNAVLQALRATVALVDRWLGEVREGPAPLNVMLTNGRLLLALRRGGPMGWVIREDGRGGTRESRPPRHNGMLSRYVFIAGDGSELPPDYEALGQGEMLLVERSLEVSRHLLTPSST